VQITEPEFDHDPLVESHCSSTPEQLHSDRPFGVPGAFVTTRPPPSVRFSHVSCEKTPIVPPASGSFIGSAVHTESRSVISDKLNSKSSTVDTLGHRGGVRVLELCYPIQ